MKKNAPRRTDRIGRALSVALVASALFFGACAKGPEPLPPQVLFSPDVYDCVVRFSSPEIAFRVDLAFETYRDEERFEFRIVEPPRLSDQWPESLPLTGWGERLLEKGMAAPYVFDRDPDARAGAFPRSRLWRYSGFAVGWNYDDVTSILYRLAADERTREAAIRNALAVALSVGAACPELETVDPKFDAEGFRRAWVDYEYYQISSRTALDAAGLVETRAFEVQTCSISEMGVASYNYTPVLTAEIARRGSSIPPGLSFGEPRRAPHQRRTDRGWFLPVIDGSTATIPLTRSVYASLFGIPESEAEALVRHNKTHQAFVNVVEGIADIAFVTEPSPSELEYARDSGVELSIVPVAREAFVFLVNAANPVESLRLEELRSIYRGEYSAWSELDPYLDWDSPIAAYTRPPDSGSQTLFEKLVLPADAIRYRELVEEGMGELVLSIAGAREPEPGSEDDEAEAVARVARPDLDYGSLGGLGYSFYFYLSEMMANPEVKLLAVDGVLPSEETIVDGSYPLLTAYYAVTKAGAEQPRSARYLLDWLATGDGEKALRAANYIPRTARSAGR